MGYMGKENTDFIVHLLSFTTNYVIKTSCIFFWLLYDPIDVFFIISIIIIMNIKSYF